MVVFACVCWNISIITGGITAWNIASVLLWLQPSKGIHHDMDLNDLTWNIVKNTQHVGKLLGGNNTPLPMSEFEVKRVLEQIEEGKVIKEMKKVFEVPMFKTTQCFKLKYISLYEFLKLNT